MKLKTVVASLVVLGLASTAANALPAQSKTVDTSVSDLSKRIAALEAVINQNQDNAANDPSTILNNDWYKNITISGEFKPNFSWSNRSQNTSGSRTDSSGGSNAFVQNQDSAGMSMRTMELYIDGQVNDFTKVHTALDYDYNEDKYATVYSSGGTTTTTTPGPELFFSEANIQLANLAKTGFYSVIGKQFFNFGSLSHDTVTAPFTDLMAQTNSTGATVGYVSSTGFNADGFAFGGNLNPRTDYAVTSNDTGSNKFRTWGANVGYNLVNPTFGLNFQADYLSNMAETVFLSQSIAYQHVSNDSTNSLTYYKQVPGVATHLDLSSGPFDLIFDYVSALKSFAQNDLSTISDSNTTGAKPSATFTQLGYNFDAYGHASTAYAAYQTTAESQDIYGSTMGGYLFPKTRTAAGYKYYLAQNTYVNLELDHDKDYPANDAGSGRTSNGVNMALDVKF